VGAEGFWVAELRVRQLKIGSKSCFGIYTQIFSPKKTGFSPIKKILSKIYLTFVCLYSMQRFSADPKIFSKKF
jgi:hypothetical protein